MDFEFLKMCLQLIMALLITLSLMFLSYKVLGKKVTSISNNKYVKVIERTQVTKDNAILIVKVGKKGYVMTSTAGHMEKISELCEEEIQEIEESKIKHTQDMIDEYSNLLSSSKKNLFKIVNNMRSKEEKNGKK